MYRITRIYLIFDCMNVLQNSIFKPGIVIRNLPCSLIYCHSGTGSNFDDHHNDTMPPRRNPAVPSRVLRQRLRQHAVAGAFSVRDRRKPLLRSTVRVPVSQQLRLLAAPALKLRVSVTKSNDKSGLNQLDY